VIVIGLGRIGLHYAFDNKRPQPASHVSAIMHNSHLNLIGVCDSNLDSLKKFHQTYGKQIISESNCTTLLKNIKKEYLDFDIVVIATPENTHYKLIKYFISVFKETKKKKIIFCEKPITSDLNTAKKIKKIVRNSKVSIVVNHSRRWSKIWQKAFKFQSQIGKIQKAAFYFSTSPENRNVSQIRDGIHIADILSWFKIQKITSINRLNLEYFLYDFHLWGTKGKIEIVNFGTELKLYKIKKSLNFQGFQELKLVSCTKFTESYLENTYQEFVNFFKDRKLLSTSLTDSINAMETFERYVYVKNMLK
jgi:hypothetical protein